MRCRRSCLAYLPSIGRVYLAVALCAFAFILACNTLFDGDFWWHLRSGEWIIENGRVPDLDPFTFGSADREWIDLHWLFQVLLALVHRAGGIPGVIVGQAVLAAASVAAGLAARRAGTSITLAVLCWLPAVAVMSIRFQTRPEMFSLLFLAVDLAVLSKLDDKPRLAWVLPVVQLFWVNVHGLFVLGPVVLIPGCSWNRFYLAGCPHCGQRLRFRAISLGGIGACALCKRMFRFPDEEEAVLESEALQDEAPIGIEN